MESKFQLPKSYQLEGRIVCSWLTSSFGCNLIRGKRHKACHSWDGDAERPWKAVATREAAACAIMIGPLSFPTLINKAWVGGLDDEDQSTNVVSDRSITAYQCYSRGRTRTARSSRGRPRDNAYTRNAGTRCRGKSGCGPRSEIVPRRSCARAHHPSAAQIPG